MSSLTELKTSKFSGLGNKILLVDLIRQSGYVDSDLVKKIAVNNQVQFDQLISIEAPFLPGLDLSAKIFNRDGGRAENCINGARCFGKYIFDSGLLNKPELLVGIEENTWKISNPERNMYAVEQEISDPGLGEEMLPELNSSGLHSLDLAGDNLEIGFVNLGNPHAIHFTTEIKTKPLDKWGKNIQESKYFPDGVNLTFAEMVSPSEVNIRVFERGVGETPACGSGACATVVKGVQLGYLQKEATVNFKTGCLAIKYDPDIQVLTAKGPADFLEETTILI